MLRHVLFDLSLFVDESDRRNSQKRVLWLLEALTRCDQLYLKAHPDTPLVYQSGITYKVPEQLKDQSSTPEVNTLADYLKTQNAPSSVVSALDTLDKMCGGGEVFRDIPRVIENGGGDCDNVAAWRCAELRERGIEAMPYITWRKRPDGGTTYHVVVLLPDGSHEDPSLLLGMGGDTRTADRQEEQRKLGERAANFVLGLSRTGNVRFATMAAFGPSVNDVRTIVGGLTVTTPQDFSQLQYSIPFQTDDAYEDWSPTRPQAYYADPQYPGAPMMPPGGGPLFNTRMRDPDDIMDRFDGLPARARARMRKALRG